MRIAAPSHGVGHTSYGSMGLDDMDLRRISVLLAELLQRSTDLAEGKAQVLRTGHNPQTDLDTRTDRFLQRGLATILDAPVISEEDRFHGATRAGLCWVVDPIDGTINAIAGTDEYAISVALVDTRELRPVIGAVYLPRFRVLYEAISKAGVSKNGQQLRWVDPGEQPRPAARILSFGVPSDIPAIATRMSRAFQRILSKGWVTRQSGAASIDICRVAAGSWSAFFEYRLMYWDFVAATLIAQEAGCHTVAVPSEPAAAGSLPLEYDLVVARTEEVLDEIVDAVGIDPAATLSRP